jgi:hypothetical protein
MNRGALVVFQGSSNRTVDEFMDGLIERIPNDYYLDLLADHDFSIQVWLEKEALAGVVHPTCIRWDVPLFCAKGYASLSFLHAAGQDLESKDRPAKIFHLGDYDPSGQNAIATVQRDLPEHAPNTAMHGFKFHIIALNRNQITEMNLPTRPTKKTDTRARKPRSCIDQSDRGRHQRYGHERYQGRHVHARSRRSASDWRRDCSAATRPLDRKSKCG